MGLEGHLAFSIFLDFKKVPPDICCPGGTDPLITQFSELTFTGIDFTECHGQS